GYKANEGIIEADVRSVSADQLHTIFTRIQALLNGEKNA
ncbi:MAG TPA: SelA-like pyridoxal phosphate-dependent enzyme, partial [Pantoea agglomerans]|nr:SelA-like pyridoxal phosphate-dependent enzyme [Pantoea agglomerans]